MRRRRSSIFIAKSGNARPALHFTDGETDMFRNRLDNMIEIRHELVRLAAICCVAFALAAQAAVAKGDRGALWQVVRTCVANHALTGAAFPCLEVNLSEGEEGGYVILRPPVGKPDTILSPTKKIVGIEDPSLRTLAAPNYFEDAWNARAFLSDSVQKPLAHDDVALAVNSLSSRTQDQLHIHIGCISRQAKQTLQAIAPQLPEDRWAPIKQRIKRFGFWGRRVAQDTLAGVNPFRLAAEGFPDETSSRAQSAIVVAGTLLANGRNEFVLLLWRPDPFGLSRPFAAEDILDPSCSL
jgi:CDP-diacylglycerol pyrophosphatase